MGSLSHYAKSLGVPFLTARENWGAGLKSAKLLKWTVPPWGRDESLSDINTKEPLFTLLNSHQLLEIYSHMYLLVFQSLVNLFF